MTSLHACSQPSDAKLSLYIRGSLGEPGSSSFMFDHKGVVTISQNEFPEECDPFEMAIEVRLLCVTTSNTVSTTIVEHYYQKQTVYTFIQCSHAW